MSTANTRAYDVATSTVYGAHVSRFCSLAAISILYYEFLATIPVEIEVIWPQVTPSFASVLFFLNRYLVLLGSVPTIFEFFGNMGDLQCHRLESFHQYFVAITQAVVAGLLTLRTYALYEGDKRILALLIAFICTGIGMSIWSVFGADEISDQTTAQFLPHACDLSLSADQYVLCLTAPWSVVMVFDTTVFVLTVVKGVRVRGILNTSVLRTFLRDGAAYYGIMVVMNIVIIVTNLPEQRGLMSTLYNVLSSVLMTRLMLNLRNSDSRRTSREDAVHGVRDDDIELTDSSLWGSSEVTTRPSIYFLDEGV
ncbi:hypothetical protein CERSUDRAFT_84347 [Gelatoporia subvermispora B]|uniref:DUF6533 domain-containing protein n=1 Tax=Ceriporiopsis subvermispora (strain B) TaxID=914234 RepID=M2RCV6_CERS8|nr:hypothetical protein CERSUDRAFT_84347 [Gelatoporia subvermispora B]